MKDKNERPNNSKTESGTKICLITDFFEEGRGGYILNHNLIQVLGSIFNGKSNVLVVNSNFQFYSNLMIFRVARVLIIELLNTFRLIKLSKASCIVFFNFGGSRFLPMLAARMLHKKSVYLVSGLAGGELKTVSSFLYRRSVFGVGATLLSSVLSCFEQINYSLADLIVAESPFLIHQISSSKHPFRPIVDGALFVDTECFSPKIELSQRAEVISYFGALAEHKGLMNFVEAVPQILKQRIDVKFTIGGGPESMLPVIERRVKELLGDENPAVVLLGRVAHAQMPNYLNETKLVVLPSYGEGLPNIVLEAMACGTPVLATRCGGIPDVIRDGENGFIMEDNSPQCIARNVIRSLNHPSLEEVALNARHLVERDYSHYSAEKRYRKILNEVSNMYK